jgi:hypothetical protein
MKKYINYCIDSNTPSIAFPDYLVEEKAKEFLMSNDECISVSTENFLLATRVLIRENIYPHNDVVFVFNGRHLAIDKHGKLIEWPVGFCDVIEFLLTRMIT